MLFGTRLQKQKFSNLFPIDILGEKCYLLINSGTLKLYLLQTCHLMSISLLYVSLPFATFGIYRESESTVTCLHRKSFANALVCSCLDYCNSLFLQPVWHAFNENGFKTFKTHSVEWLVILHASCQSHILWSHCIGWRWDTEYFSKSLWSHIKPNTWIVQST